MSEHHLDRHQPSEEEQHINEMIAYWEQIATDATAQLRHAEHQLDVLMKQKAEELANRGLIPLSHEAPVEPPEARRLHGVVDELFNRLKF